jgi:ABC-2 type transport system ATP-binding protein
MTHTASSDYAIQTRDLTRYFGAKCVVRDLNMAVPRGSIFGFLGRNGSGKTTTLRMVLGLLSPTWGGSTILGHDSQRLPPDVRARIGYLAEGHPVHGGMRVRDAEAYQSRFYPKWNRTLFHSVLEFFRVDPGTRARNLSRGERAGLCLAMALAPEPDLLILDDPAIGLDPVARRSLLESMVYATRKADRTIIFSSHLLADIERMADHIAVLDYSVLRAQCSLDTRRR